MNTFQSLIILSIVPFIVSTHHHRHKVVRNRHGSGYSWAYGSSGTRNTGYGYGWSYDEADKCPPADDECVCVPRDSCTRGYVSSDGAGVIVRRGRRSIHGMLDAIGHSLSQTYPYGYDNYNYNPHRGIGIDLGGLLSSFIPRVDVRVRKPGSSGCGDGGCDSGSRVEVNVGGGRRKCPGGDGCVIDQPRPLPPPPSQPESEPCADGYPCPGKDIDIEIPFTGIRVQVRKPGGVSVSASPSSSNPCPTCGGSSSNKPKPAVPNNNRPRCPAGQVCCKSRSTTSAPKIPAAGTCGQRSACGVDRRTGGSTRRGECEFAEYPWLAMILKKDPSSGKKEFLCNGALIDSKRVVTVSQCLEDFQDSFENIEVRLGEWDVSSQVETYPQEDYTISGLRIHEKYQNDTLINDIAVITLSEPVPNNVHISPICLPSESETFNHGSCVVTGWGNRDPIPKESYVECLNDNDCQERLRRTKLGPYYNLDEGFLCGSSRLGNCLVDGGGPLVCKRKDDTYALIGLISWSVDVNSPEVYVRVQNYLEWINDESRIENEPESQPSPSSSSISPPTTTRSLETTSASATRPTYPKEETDSSTSSQPQEWIVNRKKENDESEYSYASASGSDSSYAFASSSSSGRK